MDYINFNDLSEMGLIRQINEKVLHPFGLALSRNPINGFSEKIFVADDGIWEYKDKKEPLNERRVRKLINKLKKPVD